ncbi:MAG: response regulator transcription factor [Gammaproteobacteria bacterium]|nr:response regulator transcription factor [Gammaproteobacteria bacterium]
MSNFGEPILRITRTIHPTFKTVDANATALVVDDHPLYRDALVQLLEAILGDSGAVAADSAEQGLRIATTLPELRLVVLDIGLPGLSGTDAIVAFRRACPKTAMMVISASDDRRDVDAAFSAGAKIFVSKTVPTQDLAEIVCRVLTSEPANPEWIVSPGKTAFLRKSLPVLTARQHEILSLLSNGYSNKEIGLRAGLAEVTVKMHVSSIFRLLGVTNRTQAVLVARRLGLGTQQPLTSHTE